MTWLLTFAALGAWLLVGYGLIVRPIGIPRHWHVGGRRIVWAVLWVSALVAGSWGPDLWSRTSTDHTARSPDGVVAARTTAVLRTPMAVRSSARDFDADRQVIRAEERLALQLPVALLAFFGLVYFLRFRERRSSGNGRALGSAGVVAFLALLVACGAEPTGEDAPRPERTIVEVPWDTLAHIRVAPEDTLLFSADHIVAAEPGFWVLDRIGHRVAHFDWDGDLRWYAGRQGAGPGEFQNPRMLQVDRDGRVWVLDAGTHRITAFGSDGSFVRDLSLQPLEGVLHAFAADADGERFFGMLADNRLRPVSIDVDGRVRRGSAIRIPDLDGGFGLALQGVASSTGSGEGWVYAFMVGDGLFPMRGLDLAGRRVLYPEWVPFPGVDRREAGSGEESTTVTRLTERNFSAIDLAVAGGRILVRFHGDGPHARRLLDIYEADSGSYVETLLLPRSGRLGAWEDRILLAWNDPAPEIAVLRR